MTKDDVKITRCTRADYVEFYGEAPQRSIKAFSVRYKGELVCIAGIAMDSWFAFSDVKPCDAPKMTIWKTAKYLVLKIKEISGSLVATSENGKFLESLGFENIGQINDRQAYRL